MKPENVLLDSSGHIKLTDFGLSKASNGKMSYTFAGTPEYVAPEVLTGKGYNFKADFWSLGVIIFEMLAGRTPFGDTTGDLAKTLIQVVQNKPKFPAFFNESSIDLIKKLLHEDPEKRLGSNGFNEIKNHAFFKRINWKNVENLKTKPPLIAVAKNKNLENINGIGNEEKVIESFGNVDMPNFSRISYDSNLQQSIRNILDER